MASPSSLISLKVVEKRFVDEVLACWSDEIEFLREKVKDLVSNDNPLKWVIVGNIDPTPFRSVLSSARNHYGASVVLETPYLDVESWDSYSSFYSATFSTFERESVRLHFFQCSEDEVQKVVAELLGGSSENELSVGKGAYKGYCVLRPLPTYNVGRSAVEFSENPNTKVESMIPRLPLEAVGHPHLTTSHLCQVRILNAKFRFYAPEFIQQDPNLGHCATASLWVANKIVSDSLGANNHRYGAITRRAHRENGLSFSPNGLSPSPDERKGLSSVEIKNAFLAAGLGYQNSCLDMRGGSLDAFVSNAHLIYSYVESGLPVLFCLKRIGGKSFENTGHVVTSVGHSLPRFNATPPKEYDNYVKRVCSHSRHVPIGALSLLYYVHDDCYGPYNRLQIAYPEFSIIQKCSSTFFKVLLGRKQLDYNLQEIIVPVHSRHRSNALLSLWDAQKALDYELKKLQEKTGKKMFSDDVIFVWRSFLTQSSDFKDSICRRGYASSLRKKIARLHLSKYIWVHEYSVTTKDSIYNVFPEQPLRQITGEYLYDATSPKSHVHLLAKRNFFGYWWDYSMGSGEEYHVDKDATGYECYVRSKKMANWDDEPEKYSGNFEINISKDAPLEIQKEGIRQASLHAKIVALCPWLIFIFASFFTAYFLLDINYIDGKNSFDVKFEGFNFAGGVGLVVMVFSFLGAVVAQMSKTSASIK